MSLSFMGIGVIGIEGDVRDDVLDGDYGGGGVLNIEEAIFLVKDGLLNGSFKIYDEYEFYDFKRENRLVCKMVPTFQYQCNRCPHKLATRESISLEVPNQCPQCHGQDAFWKFMIPPGLIGA